MGTLVRNNRNLFPTIPSFFEEMLGKDWLNWPSASNTGSAGSMPAVNVRETNEAYELEVAAPGMNKQDFKVELDNNLLIISAEKENKQEDQDNKGNYSRREFSYQSFVRTFNLPEQMVQGDKIAASYKDGVLLVSIPKTDVGKVKQVKQIKIS
jgi:HSP20 family protein